MLEDLENITPESYNKLLAWMVEMAQNEEADLGSPEFIEHITSACAAKQRNHTHSNTSTRQHSLDTTLTDTRLNVPRQHSLDSSCGSKCSRSSRSREDLLDPKTRFNRSKRTLKRQETIDYSDDGEAPIDVSAGSSFDHDYDIVSPDTVLINQYSESETSFCPQLRPQLRKNQSCTTYRNIGSSLADLLNVNSKCKSKSLAQMGKMLSETKNDDEIRPFHEEAIAKLLDDNLLDRNMADILYSVEALWPKYPK